MLTPCPVLTPMRLITTIILCLSTCTSRLPRLSRSRIRQEFAMTRLSRGALLGLGDLDGPPRLPWSRVVPQAPPRARLAAACRSARSACCQLPTRPTRYVVRARPPPCHLDELDARTPACERGPELALRLAPCLVRGLHFARAPHARAPHARAPHASAPHVHALVRRVGCA
jgi:hypothetical protein